MDMLEEAYVALITIRIVVAVCFVRCPHGVRLKIQYDMRNSYDKRLMDVSMG